MKTNKQYHKKPELLAPAGNFEKLKAALRFGADAVYLSGKAFGMRAGADNFSEQEIFEAAEYTHAHGKKLYLTVNTMPRTDEYQELAAYLKAIAKSGVDALIIADPGVLMLAKECAPELALHISTQTGVVSAADCLFWAQQGASRIVLARELSFADIAQIRSRIPDTVELEAFIHGSMCVSFSGRCLLSENLLGRDANRGQCAQPCRWNFKRYEISEEKRPQTRFPVEQTPDGTFILSSRDLCMIEHIPQLCESGICSLKIEGRMKSAYYAAVCSNTYRMAIDRYWASPDTYAYDPNWLAELESVSHREYCTGYFFDRPQENAQLCETTGYLREKAYLATVLSYENGVAVLTQRNKLTEGQEAEVISPGSCGVPFTVRGLRAQNGEKIESAPHPYMTFSMQIPFPVKQGDIVRGK